MESPFNKDTGPEAFYPRILQNLQGQVFYRTAPVAATDYSGLCNFVSNSTGTSLVKENYFDFKRI